METNDLKFILEHYNITDTSRLRSDVTRVPLTATILQNLAVADSVCLGNFMTVDAVLLNVRSITKPIGEKFPNGQIIKSTMQGELNLLMLLETARKAHVFPSLNQSLVSIGALCDAGCNVIFK